MQIRWSLLPLLLFSSATFLIASVVGTNTPALSLTPGRIAALPPQQRAAWADYLERSNRQRAADQAFLAAEVKQAGLQEPLIPPNGWSARMLPLDRPVDWYAGKEALRLADIVVSFQTPAGGWGKNLNLADHPRRLGESFAPNNRSRFLSPDDFDTPHDPDWNYVGTLDNGATVLELQFLAKVIGAVDARSAAPYRTSFLKGVQYLLDAQFPNGGWPQVWPLEGGYHDAITFNDNAVTGTLELLESIAEGGNGFPPQHAKTGRVGDPFAFVPKAVRARARKSVARGIDCILAAQIVDNGRRAVWGQQHDALDLRPVAGRNYEPAALCGEESADVVLFLMKLPRPSPKVVEAVEAAVAWFRKTALYDQTWTRTREGSSLTMVKGAGPIWPRYNEIGSDRPVFGDRDKSIHDRVDELSSERRDHYSWYNSEPQAVLERYAAWKQKR